MRVNDRTADVAGLAQTSSTRTGASASCSPSTWIIPQSSGEFERCWRRQCSEPALKYDYLMSMPSEDVERVFKMEMSGVLIAEIVMSLRSEFARRYDDGGKEDGAVEARRIVDLLEAMTRTGRFGLNSKLVGKAAKSALTELVDDHLSRKLGGSGRDASTDVAVLGKLKQLYGLNV